MTNLFITALLYMFIPILMLMRPNMTLSKAKLIAIVNSVVVFFLLAILQIIAISLDNSYQPNASVTPAIIYGFINYAILKRAVNDEPHMEIYTEEELAQSEAFETNYSSESEDESEDSENETVDNVSDNIKSNTPVTPTISKRALLSITPPRGIRITDEGLPAEIGAYSYWGHKFNAYILDDDDYYYHKGGCKCMQNNLKKVIHIYDAIRNPNLHPCIYCKPQDKIDKWYEKQLR